MARLSEQIVGLLGVTPALIDPMSQFEAWVSVRTARVRNAAQSGHPALRLELAQLRGELSSLKSIASPALLRSEQLWLRELIELVGEVLPDEPSAVAMQACA